MTAIRDSFDDAYVPEPTSGCWIWLRSLDSEGYGQLNIGARKLQLAHRFSYERTHGPLKSGDNVLHRCDVRCCVNPSHLFIGTKKDNAVDMARKGRAGGRKLSVGDVLAIRKDNRSLTAIAKDYGVYFTLVSAIKRRLKWAYLEDER